MPPASVLPLELILSGRALTEPKLSPSGESAAFVQKWRGAASIQQVGLNGEFRERSISFGAEPAPGRGFTGGCFAWLPSGRGIVYAARDGELWRVIGTELDRLTDHGRTCRGPAVQTSVAMRADLLAYVVDDAEVWIMDLSTSETRRIDDGRHGFCFDPAIAPGAVTVSWQGWSAPQMAWDASERVDYLVADGRISAWRPSDGAVQQPRFAPDGTQSCVHDGSGWANVYVGDRAVVPEEFEHGGPTWGMGQHSYGVGIDGSVAFVRNHSGFGQLCLADGRGSVISLDPEFTGVHGHLSLVGDRLAVLRSGPSTPAEIAIFELPGNSLDGRVVAGAGAGAWSAVDDVIPDRVAVASGDVTLHARRYPADPLMEARGMLCWVHGGPTDQWMVEFRPRILYWTSRGWEVLVVDPRGTTGHGRRYQQALRGGWGRVDVDDTAMLIRHAQTQGWATSQSTVVIGASSGGLTALGLLADFPDIVAGGIVSYPVSDLTTLGDETQRFEAHYSETLVGPSTDADLYRRLSPLGRAAQIAGPLLIFHGTDDRVVGLEQSERLVEKIREAGGMVEFVVYEGEGHGFGDSENQRDEYARTERFLSSI